MGQLRIIGGRLKGRRIDVPDLPELRPTGERVREALFDILGPSVAGARVLDAYSGSGALGLEALSRGAAEVVFVESDARAARALRLLLDRLGVQDRSELRHARVSREALQGLERFDLILADPPYASDEARSFLAFAAALLAAGGRIVLERESKEPPLVTARGLALTRSARYGRSRLDFYGASSSPEGTDRDAG